MPAGPVHMAARRQAIIDAAERLIRERGSTDFTMAELAREAGVSAATPFNLFDSKLTLLYALLVRSLDGVNDAGQRAKAEPDAFIRLMRAAEGVGRFFTADAGFYRPLHQVLLGAIDPVHRPDYLARALLFWQVAIEGLEEMRLFSEIQPRDQLACELIGMALGRVDLWVHGEIDDRDFPSHMAHGALALAVGLTTGARREHVLRLMSTCRPRTPAALRWTAAKKRAHGPGPAKAPRLSPRVAKAPGPALRLKSRAKPPNP